MMGMPLFFNFLAIQKIIKKSTPQKSFFFDFFAIVGNPLTRFYRFGDPKRGPGRSIFNLFFHRVFDIDFGPFFAKKNKKPILLSIGYASCHWCHVMAHESFEDKETAGVNVFKASLYVQDNPVPF